MDPLAFQSLVKEYVRQNPYLKEQLKKNSNMPVSYLLSMMQNDGFLSPEEVSSILSGGGGGSIFGYGYAEETISDIIGMFPEEEDIPVDNGESGSLFGFIKTNRAENTLKTRREYANKALLEFTKASPSKCNYADATTNALYILATKNGSLFEDKKSIDQTNIALILNKIPTRIYIKSDLGKKLVNYFLNNSCDITYENVIIALESFGIEVQNPSNLNELKLKIPDKLNNPPTMGPVLTKEYELDVDKLSDDEIKKYAIDYLYETIMQTSEMFHNYYKNIGYVSGDAVWQGLKIIADKATFNQLVDTIFEQMNFTDELLKEIGQLRNSFNLTKSKKLRDKNLDELFEKITGNKYDKNKIKNFIKAKNDASNARTSETSREFMNVHEQAFGKRIQTIDSVMKKIGQNKKAGAVCEVAMLIAFYELTGGVPSSLFGGVLSETMVGTALSEGLSYAIYNTLTDGLSLMASDLSGKKDVNFDDFTDFLCTFGESFAVGAFAGINAELLSPILESYLSKKFGRVAGNLTEKLAEALVVGIQMTMLQLGTYKNNASAGYDIEGIKELLIEREVDTSGCTAGEREDETRKIMELSDNGAIIKLFLSNCKEQVSYQFQETSLELLLIGDS